MVTYTRCEYNLEWKKGNKNLILNYVWCCSAILSKMTKQLFQREYTPGLTAVSYSWPILDFYYKSFGVSPFNSTDHIVTFSIPALIIFSSSEFRFIDLTQFTRSTNLYRVVLKVLCTYIMMEVTPIHNVIY